MRQALTLHPDSRCTAATCIEVDAQRPRPGALLLRYRVSGRLDGLRLAPPAAPARADGLWRHTCFEAFVRAGPDAAYYEFNFAPSTQWAAYRFTGHRVGMGVAQGVAAPRIHMQSGAGGCLLEAALELDRLPGLPPGTPWRLGLAAVIEEADGRTSYWALAHPPGRPDFHHAAGFVHELGVAWGP